MNAQRFLVFLVCPLALSVSIPLVGCQDPSDDEKSDSHDEDPSSDPEGKGKSEKSDKPGDAEDGNHSPNSEEKDSPKDGNNDPSKVPDAPTWHEHVAPILVKHCSGCHAEGEIAPFRLDRYKDAKASRRVIMHAIDNRTMPPFLAHDTDRCTPPLPWLGDNRLSKTKIETIRRWVDKGAPEGNPKNAAKLQPPPDPTLPKVDLTVKTGQSIKISGTKDQFKCVTVDPGFTKDTYVNGAQFIPGNTNVVHHAIAYIDDKGQSAAKAPMYDCFGGPQLSSPRILSSWAPGAQPMQTPKDSAIKVPAGARIVLNIHYHPTGNGEEVDTDTALALSLADGPPKINAENIFIGNFESPLMINTGLHPGPNDRGRVEFRIPANAKGHTEHMQFGIPTVGEIRVWLVSTHMHYVGRKSRIWIEHAGQEQCLIETPKWDFNWQMGYAYDADFSKYPVIGPGDSLHIECEYDNSMDNPFVQEALEQQGKTSPVDVYLGEETLDEMCLGTIGLLAPNDGTYDFDALRQPKFPTQTRLPINPLLDP